MIIHTINFYNYVCTQFNYYRCIEIAEINAEIELKIINQSF